MVANSNATVKGNRMLLESFQKYAMRWSVRSQLCQQTFQVQAVHHTDQMNEGDIERG